MSLHANLKPRRLVSFSRNNLLFLRVECLEQRLALSVTFVDSGQTLGDQHLGFITGLSLGDLDSDGDLDAFVTSRYSPNTVLLNDGSGRFAIAERHLLELESKDVELGDVDNDGDLDAIIANSPRNAFSGGIPKFATGGPDTVWLNDGTGSFEHTQSVGERTSFDIDVGDIDADGDLDAFVAGKDSGVWINDGKGRFDFSELSGVTFSQLGQGVLGDVDGDDDLDVVASSGSLEEGLLFLNEGDGMLVPHVAFEGSARGVHLENLDQDSTADLFVMGNSANGFNNEVYFNQGDGQFVNSQQSLRSNADRGVSSGDIDGDTDIDVVVAHTRGEQVWLNDGNGVFVDGKDVDDRVYGVRVISLGDVDGDSDLDLVVGYDNLHTWLNDGEGGFTRVATIGDTIGEAVALGDIDGDGDIDAMISNATEANEIWLNDGSGEFSESVESWRTSVEFDAAETDLVLGDLDGDGDLDVLVTGPSSNVWLNDGRGRFVDSVQDLNVIEVALGDVDNDGDLDALVQRFGQEYHEDVFRIYLNDGTSNLVDTGQLLGRSDADSGTLVDLDGDGDLDVVIGTIASDHSELWFNDGRGVFTFGSTAFDARATSTIAFEDLDGDGDLDAFVATSRHDVNTIWLNDGMGHFTDTGQQLGGQLHTRDVSLVDVDADGDIDAIVANQLEFGVETNQLWINDGQGTFTENDQPLGTSGLSIDVDDLDGDGDLDVFFTNLGNNHVWLNVGEDEVIMVPGDANRDGQVDEHDAAQVIFAGKYLTGLGASWEEGDWNGDGVFDQLDIVLSLQ